MGRDQRLGVAAEQHCTFALQRVIDSGQPMRSADPHYAGVMPAVKRQAHVPSSGGDYHLPEAQQTGVVSVGQAGNRALDPGGGALLRKQPPHRCAQSHIDPGVERLGDLRTRIKQGLQHAIAIGDCGAHTATEMQRHFFSHGLQRQWIFVYQRHAQAMPGSSQGGSEPCGPGANDEDIGLVADRRSLAGHRSGIVIGVWIERFCHRCTLARTCTVID